MTFIAENTERLHLLEKSLELEEKQKKRLHDLSIQRQKESEEAKRKALLQGNQTNSSILDQEEAQRKELMATLIRDETPSNGPVVKVLTNVQGIGI